MDEQLQAAVLEYFKRRMREVNPAGRFDSAGRWYPKEAERRPCCDTVRPPSKRYPYSLLLHCRTATHVAALYGVDARELRRAWRNRSTAITGELENRMFYLLPWAQVVTAVREGHTQPPEPYYWHEFILNVLNSLLGEGYAVRYFTTERVQVVCTREVVNIVNVKTPVWFRVMNEELYRARANTPTQMREALTNAWQKALAVQEEWERIVADVEEYLSTSDVVREWLKDERLDPRWLVNWGKIEHELKGRLPNGWAVDTMSDYVVVFHARYRTVCGRSWTVDDIKKLRQAVREDYS